MNEDVPPHSGIFAGDTTARIADLERRLADARARLPRHSVPAAMQIEIEDLEDELGRLREALREQDEARG